MNFPLPPQERPTHWDGRILSRVRGEKGAQAFDSLQPHRRQKSKTENVTSDQCGLCPIIAWNDPTILWSMPPLARRLLLSPIVSGAEHQTKLRGDQIVAIQSRAGGAERHLSALHS